MKWPHETEPARHRPLTTPHPMHPSGLAPPTLVPEDRAQVPDLAALTPPGTDRALHWDMLEALDLSSIVGRFSNAVQVKDYKCVIQCLFTQ